jgi:hypothetical protein
MKFSTALMLVALLVACSSSSSDEQQVRELVDTIETAAEQRDASDVIALVADGYEDSNGFDKTQLRNFLRGYFLAHPELELVVDISRLEFPADGIAQAEIAVSRISMNDPGRVRLKVEFRRGGDGWRVQRADRVGP